MSAGHRSGSVCPELAGSAIPSWALLAMLLCTCVSISLWNVHHLFANAYYVFTSLFFGCCRWEMLIQQDLGIER